MRFSRGPLGPLLFIIYINDIANQLDKNEVFYNIYAEDTVIVGSGESDLNAASTNCCMLQHIMDWCKLNWIVLNQKKTKHVYVGPKCKIREDLIEFETVGEPIKRVREFRYFGVIIDENLSFQKQLKG